MNRLARKIAWRYLFSKKSHSAINAISIVSVCGVAITTLALVCTLSVYNGFTELIGSLYSQIDPQIKITPLQGKTLDTEEEAIEQIAEWNEVKTFTPVIEENALCIYKDRQRPVLVKGVPDNYTELSHIQDIVTSGTFQLNDGRIDYVSLGISVAGQLGVVANSPYPVELYAPNRLGKVNLAIRHSRSTGDVFSSHRHSAPTRPSMTTSSPSYPCRRLARCSVTLPKRPLSSYASLQRQMKTNLRKN